MIEFTASGAPPVVSRAIEEVAAGQGSVTALVVPWESHGDTWNMAVTSVRSDGWAIEHTNLGTITLTDLGDGRTRVAAVADEPDHVEKQKLVALFDCFADQVQRRLECHP